MKNERSLFLCVLAAALSVTTSVAFWGCKPSTSAPENGTAASAVPPTPVLHVLTATGDPLAADPLTDPLWQHAVWSTLGAPLQESRTTPPTRAASFYTPSCLYVAFICEDHNTRWGAQAPSATPHTPPANDRVEVWLDTSAAQNGTEVFSVQASADGKITRAWYRSSTPPAPKDDGSPDFTLPMSQLPDYQVPGLAVHTHQGQIDGKAAWATVLAIPLQGLPGPLRVPAKDIKEGAHWRVNLLRSDVTAAATGGKEDVLQSNLAPVYPECQQVSPYRMAEMFLEGPNSSLALQAGN